MKRLCMQNRGDNTRWMYLLSLLLLPLLLNGCGYTSNTYSYLNILDNVKKTVANKKAAEQFWSSVRPVSTLSASHYKLGNYYLQQEKYNKAIEEFSKAVRNDSKFCKAYNGIAMSYDALKSCDMAHDWYKKAIQCDPDQAYVYNNYACSSLLCGDYKKGLTLLQKAAARAKDNQRIHNNITLAQAFVKQEQDKVTAPHSATAVDSPNEPAAATISASTTISPLPPAVAGNQPTSASPIHQIAVHPVPEKNRPTVDTMATPPTERSNTVYSETDAAPESIEVLNGNGVNGMAARSAEYFRGYGFDVQTVTNAANFHFNKSIIFYTEGHLQAATKLAELLPGNHEMVETDTLGSASVGVRILLGKDLVSMQFPEGYTGNGTIEVYNGNGVNGMAARSAEYFRGYGFAVQTVTNAANFDFNKSIISYTKGHLQVAGKLAELLPGNHEMVETDTLGSASVGARVLLGKDLATIQFPVDRSGNGTFAKLGKNTFATPKVNIGECMVTDQAKNALAWLSR